MSSGRLSYIASFLENVPTAVGVRFFHKRRDLTSFNGQKGITLEYSKALIKEYIERGEPFCAVRFGASELGCLNATEKIDLGFKKTYKEAVRIAMKERAGYYPTGDRHLSEYSHYFFEKCANCDLLGITGIHMEDYFAAKYMKKAKAIQNWALEPLLGGWTPLLAGKKVLVVSGFADDIQKQYTKREKLFPPSSNILPEFDLKVLEAPLTCGDVVDERFPSFMRYLEEMEERIRLIDFDIALIGAGAYGALLCFYIKSLGKMALQTGGATQTLFGIMGKRWENREHVAKCVNEYWIRPSKKPAGYQKIEGGCYW